jgi:hypothetical protein
MDLNIFVKKYANLLMTLPSEEKSIFALNLFWKFKVFIKVMILLLLKYLTIFTHQNYCLLLFFP